MVLILVTIRDTFSQPGLYKQSLTLDFSRFLARQRIRWQEQRSSQPACLSCNQSKKRGFQTVTGFPNGRKAALVARARAAQLCCEQLGESCNPGLENLGESGEIRICLFCRETLKYVTFRRKTQKKRHFCREILNIHFRRK